MNHFNTLQVTHARVDLAVSAEIRATLEQHSQEFGYRGLGSTQVYCAGVNQGSAAEVSLLNESDPPTMASVIPAGCLKETLE